MFRFGPTKMSTLSFNALVHLEEVGEVVTTEKLAEHLDCSPASLAKCLQRLSRHNFVESTRGARGGFLLARPASEISLLSVIELFDGPVIPPGDVSTICSVPGDGLMQAWLQALKALRNVLATHTVASAIGKGE